MPPAEAAADKPLRGLRSIAQFVVIMDTSIIGVALPEIQRDLDASTTSVTWVLTVYLLTASVATPILGKLGDQYGKERVLVIALVLFLVGLLSGRRTLA